MKRNVLVVFVAVGMLVAAGCDSMGANTKKGVGIGGVLGAVAGGVVGHNTGGHGVEGALIGGALGAGAGGLIGSGMDDEAKNKEVPAASATSSSQLTILKVVDMSKAGTPDDVIIDEIQKTGSAFEMDDQTVQYLKDSKVSEKVIGYMLSTKK